MTLTWKEELNLLNDEQLGRIAFVDKDKWESSYYYWKGDGGCRRCVMGHLLDLSFFTMYKLKEYREQLRTFVSPLQEYYDEFWLLSKTEEQRKEMLEERVNNIQNEAKRILEERKQRVVAVLPEEPEIVTA